jgi:hypothetical protein
VLNAASVFGGEMKTCSVSGAYMAENAETLVPQGLTEAQFSGAQAKGQLGVAFAKIEKGEIKKYAKIADGVNDNGDSFTLIYQGLVQVGRSQKHSIDVLKTQASGRFTHYNAGFNSPLLQDLMEQAKWKFGRSSRPSVAAGTAAKASVGAMSDEDVATLFVVIKDDLAKEKGINIKGVNTALDKEVFQNIGDRIGYTAIEVSNKVSAYRATGKKLSVLKKKALRNKPVLPKKPSQPAVPKEMARKKTGITWESEPNGVPTQATVALEEEILAKVAKRVL